MKGPGETWLSTTLVELRVRSHTMSKELSSEQAHVQILKSREECFSCAPESHPENPVAG
jgi:hypothetical protein